MAKQSNARRPSATQSGRAKRPPAGRKATDDAAFHKFANWFLHPEGEVDYPFLLAVGLLLVFGLVMLFSAGSARAYAEYDNSLKFFMQQLRGAGIGLLAMFALSRLDYHKIGKWSFLILVISVFLLILVIIPGVGTTSNGATRWLFGFQPSEIAKFALILFFAFSLSKNRDKLSNFVHGFLPYIGVLGVFIILLALEPHFSCIVLITLTALLLLFLAGAKIKHFLAIGIPGLIGAIFMVALEPYRLQRITSFLDPFADARGDGWQIVQSLYAIGSGGIFGVGLGQSRQKYQSLPEPHNDFIFSVLAEELGLVGALALVALFLFLLIRGIKIATKAPDMFGTLLVAGIVSIVVIQAAVNIAVVTSSVPVTGMPLPFFSYGGTALSITLAEMGVVLNVSRQTRHPIQ